MLCTLRDPIVLTYMETHKIKSFVSRCDVQIVFTSVGYIKLDHFSHKMCYINCVIKG